jgi:hypothetical protein
VKVKIKCDKRYGNPNKGWMDADFFDTKLLSELVHRFVNNGYLEITEEFVDEYNSRKTTPCRKSFKTAENITKQIKKIYKN